MEKLWRKKKKVKRAKLKYGGHKSVNLNDTSTFLTLDSHDNEIKHENTYQGINKVISCLAYI